MELPKLLYWTVTNTGSKTSHRNAQRTSAVNRGVALSTACANSCARQRVPAIIKTIIAATATERRT
jgi:hypothetical protein